MKTGFVFLATLFITLAPAPGALAQTPTREAALDPVGKYDITVDIEGSTITSVITVARQNGRLAGTMLVHGEEIPFARVSQEQQTVTLSGPNPHGEGTVNMTITFKTNDRFEGTFSMHGSTGKVKGTRAKTRPQTHDRSEAALVRSGRHELDFDRLRNPRSVFRLGYRPG